MFNAILFWCSKRERVRSTFLKAVPCFAGAVILILGQQTACDAYRLSAAEAVKLSPVRGAAQHHVRLNESYGRSWTGLVWLDQDKNGSSVIVVRRDEASLNDIERFTDKIFRLDFTLPRKFRPEAVQKETCDQAELAAGIKLKPVDRCEICSWRLAQLRLFRSATQTGTSSLREIRFFRCSKKRAQRQAPVDAGTD